MRLWMIATLAAVWITAPAVSGAGAPDTAQRLIEIVLEKKTGDSVQTVDPGHVFQRGDVLRLHLKPAFDGYLYVMNLSTSGKYEVLFPREETGNDNRIEHGHDYLVPATPDGWFEVQGPAGHETLYFVMSPVALTNRQVQAAPKQPATPQGTPPPDIKPRCNDGIFKARGECVDSSAGARQVTPGETLPDGVSSMAGQASRDLNFTRKSSTSVVTTAAPLKGPAVYEFLLAHE